LDVVDSLAKVLQAFPDLPIRIEGHAKGRPADNSPEKVDLSKERAESVRDALREQGVPNQIFCAGEGSAQGLGVGVRISAFLGNGL